MRSPDLVATVLIVKRSLSWLHIKPRDRFLVEMEMKGCDRPTYPKVRSLF
ncbi:hypothetical protein VB713_21145 [Anabaena cylindrica UHCC 0172]|nr:hypothetical protein [Anabaena cylindrica]MEA5553448.1 hypothetical protein [Anabaena cylindrica UHCC 0172]